MHIQANGLQFEVEIDGPTQGTPVLLTMGLGMQLVDWPDTLVQGLVQQGYRVIRYDNRDAGLSTHLSHLGQPFLPWQLAKYKMGLTLHAPYTLQDMAQDAIGVLDALHVPQAHVLGVSMGGMISQRLAACFAPRVLSLSSIMSSSSAPGLPEPATRVTRAMLRRPASLQVNDLVQQQLQLFECIGGGSTWTGDPERYRLQLRQRLQRAIERNFDPQATIRQIMAVAADVHRYQLLGRIACPTLVIHGVADPLLPVACGQDTAARIPHAHWVPIEGMGHDWPPALVQHWLQFILPHLGGVAGG